MPPPRLGDVGRRRCTSPDLNPAVIALDLGDLAALSQRRRKYPLPFDSHCVVKTPLHFVRAAIMGFFFFFLWSATATSPSRPGSRGAAQLRRRFTLAGCGAGVGKWLKFGVSAERNRRCYFSSQVKRLIWLDAARYRKRPEKSVRLCAFLFLFLFSNYYFRNSFGSLPKL